MALTLTLAFTPAPAQDAFQATPPDQDHRLFVSPKLKRYLRSHTS